MRGVSMTETDLQNAIDLAKQQMSTGPKANLLARALLHLAEENKRLEGAVREAELGMISFYLEDEADWDYVDGWLSRFGTKKEL